MKKRVCLDNRERGGIKRKERSRRGSDFLLMRVGTNAFPRGLTRIFVPALYRRPWCYGRWQRALAQVTWYRSRPALRLLCILYFVLRTYYIIWTLWRSNSRSGITLNTTQVWQRIRNDCLSKKRLSLCNSLLPHRSSTIEVLQDRFEVQRLVNGNLQDNQYSLSDMKNQLLTTWRPRLRSITVRAYFQRIQLMTV